MVTLTHPMSAATLLALCIWDEARNQSIAGQTAVAQVVLNRMRLKHFSDGSVQGTVLRKDQFSGFWFDWRPWPSEGAPKRYVRVCRTQGEAMRRAYDKLAAIPPNSITWGHCMAIASGALNRTNTATNPLIVGLKDAVFYYNPEVVTKPPAWAIKENLVATIGDHVFYKA